MRYGYFIIVLALLLLSGCSRKVARVGETLSTSSDISLRARVSEVYYPGSGKDYVALAQLIKGYLCEEVLKSLGHKIDSSVLEGEAKRIDENTKVPDILKKIKDIYGKNRKAYIKTFIRVVYAERVLYNEVFLKSREIQKDAFSKAEKFLKKVTKSPEEFQKVAKEDGLEVRRLVLSLKNGIIPYGEKRERANIPSGIEQAERLISLVSKLKRGEVYPEVIEWQEGYQVIRYIKREGDEMIVDSIGIPKKDFDSWFWEMAARVSVEIYDKKLEEEFLKEVSWARNLNLK